MIASLAAMATVLTAGPGRADVHAGVEAYKQGDYETALREFVDLAESGDPRAQYNLAVMYLKGRGVEKNLARAFDLQQRAAKGGLAAAQHGLAIMYYRGEGVDQDYRHAATWFRRAADRGFPTSQLNLGVMYFTGQGVERNDAEVVKWITLAAAKGLPEALFRLGKMYEQGAIFRQSTQDAIYWFGKSGERGHADGENQVKRLTAKLAAQQGARDVEQKEAAAKKPGSIGPGPGEAGPVIPEPVKSGVKKAHDPAMAVKAPLSPSAASSSPPAMAKTVESDLKLTLKSSSKPESPVWRAQLASFRTVKEAERAWKELMEAFREEFESLKPDIVRVDLGAKRGVYHRLRATPLANRDAAFAFCNKLKSKSARQGCIPLSPKR